MDNLNGSIVFITGASSGIGEACAFAFAREGARLLLCARRVDRLEEMRPRLLEGERPLYMPSRWMSAIATQSRARSPTSRPTGRLSRSW